MSRHCWLSLVFFVCVCVPSLGVATPKIDGPGGSGSHDGSLKGKGTKTSTRWSGLFSSSYKVLELAFFLAELV